MKKKVGVGGPAGDDHDGYELLISHCENAKKIKKSGAGGVGGGLGSVGGQDGVTRWTKHTFPCSKFLSPGVSFGLIQHLRGLNSIKLGYLNFTDRLT